jgi:uncharacterized protein
MTVELKPLGVKCNLHCHYCYQNPERDAGNVLHSYDIDTMKSAIEAAGGRFNLFGGEALLIPEDDLEALWSWGLEKFGRNSIQTNGVLINDNHIRMFKQYRVSVGISIDGPGELNDARWTGTLKGTRESTAKIERVIERLCREGIPPSLIITLHRNNATRDKLPVMHDWFRHLETIGITQARLHILEVENESVRIKYALDTEQNLEAYLSFLRLEDELTTLKFDVFDDMKNLLLGRDGRTACVWNACDPYTTRAVQGVEGNGQRSNCSRTNKDGIAFSKSALEGFERYLALYQTPQENGGCQGCRYFLMCKGQCPGTAIDGDWRNRTEHCGVWKGLFGHLEERLLERDLIPISAAQERAQLEQFFVESWANGRNTTIEHALLECVGHRSLCREGQSTPMGATRGPASGRPDFSLPDFTRMSWVSDRAREVWGPRMRRITKAWFEIEWLSVAAAIRPCGLTLASPEEFLAQAGKWAKHGLSALPVELLKTSGDSDSSADVQSEPQSPLVFRFVVGTPRNVSEFQSAWDASDQEAMGRLLGYPRCCHAFFRHVWVEQGLVDTTWPMALASTGLAHHSTRITVQGPPETNIFWRWMGIRAIPHLPCRSDCAPSADIGKKMVELGRDAGYSTEMDWLLEILSWPVEWSALHGIAEVKTPVLKVTACTDATLRKYEVRREGTAYPFEGAQGLGFPYRARHGVPAVATNGTHLSRPILGPQALEPQDILSVRLSNEPAANPDNLP